MNGTRDNFPPWPAKEVSYRFREKKILFTEFACKINYYVFTMPAIMLLKASEPGRVVVGGGAVGVDVVSEEVGVVLGVGFKGRGRVPRPRLGKSFNILKLK